MTRPLAGPQTLLRTMNARAILEALARRGALTRAELMTETGLSRTAVTQVLRMLESRDAVASAGVERATKGPAATRVGLNPRLGVAAAIHIDHHDIHVVLLDATGAIRAEAHGPLPVVGDRVEAIAALLDECRATTTAPVLVAVVAVPGIVRADGEIRDDQGPDGGAFRAALAERLGCPVRIENDVNLAALAELSGPVGAEQQGFALLLLDDGLGAAYIVDGALHRGVSGIAGEINYLPQTPLPVGAPVLGHAVTADLALVAGRDSSLPLPAHLEAAASGDESARVMAAEIARRLVLIAGSITLVMDPGLIVLAGDAAHPVLFEAVRGAAEEFDAQLPLSFALSAFGAEAPLVGAVSQATEALRATLFTRIVTPASSRT
ncbi:ROK family transcriptional regulator [Microbacterium bovistercoris]|uniref:ROK family transcriptional regulator n=1 Tax=Microbacterium bovistercoris TaxID=2293570 RepID=A0A371NZP8_9MICO|nr:ROK family transcriptional regulator [Microbacterium bovistercoris]REJ08347.1 ROK family transcriptional regulator [Microbacterium bovistercoris]